jgi:hypothetical protein
MGDRLKIFFFVAILGFFAGMIADFAARYAIPALANILPALFGTTYLLSGFAGACLTLVLVSVWAYVTGPRER